MEFRFGAYLSGVTERAALMARCRLVEELGYDVISPSDHLGGLSPVAAMMVAAEATSRVRIAPLVINAGFYNPVLLARDLVSVDICTGGRVEVGLGTGFTADEFARIGVPYARAGDRIDHLIRTVETLRSYCSDPAEPTPVQLPCPPVLIAGSGPRMLRTAVEHADIVGFSGGYSDAAGAIHMLDADQLVERMAVCDEFARERDKNPERNIHVYFCAVTDDRDGALERIAREDGGSDLAPQQLAELPTVLVGSAAEIVDQLHAHRERFGFTYYSIPDPDVEQFADVIQLLR
jgi:probable F420-dependent oxidoreductase